MNDLEKPKVLIVEDDAIIAEQILTSLGLMGYRVIGVAASGEDALAQASAGRPDLALMDIHLRGEMNGIQAAEQIRLQMEIPIIYLTAYTEESLIQASTSTHAYGYLVKPVRERELRASIETALYKAEADRRLKHLNQMLRTVREVSQLIIREKDRFSLMERACQILYQLRENCLVWVRLDQESEEGAVPLAGTKEAVLFWKAVSRRCNELTSECPHHTALRERKAVIVQDIAAENSFGDWREKALASCLETGFEFRSGGWAPLLHGEQCYGVLCVLSVHPNLFTAEETELLQELANDLGFALHNIDLDEENKRTEKALRRATQRYRSLFEEAPAMYVITRDVAGTLVITDCNQRFCQTLGYHLEEILQRPLVEFYSPASRLLLMNGGFERTMAGLMGTEERELVRRDGSILPAAIQATPEIDAAGQTTGTQTMFIDITERKKAVEQLEQLTEQLRSLAVRQQTAIEVERAHIAREIHDEFGQSMTALKMDMTWLVKRMPEDDEKTERIRGMIAQVDDTIALIRRTATELRPQMLDDLGLNAALEWQAQEFTRRSGIPCRLKLPKDNLTSNPALNTTLFRIFQEALTNITRHAQATRVTTCLKKSDHTLILTIRDNGRGITQAELNDPGSLGLLGLRERAAQWGGKVAVSGRAGKGTSVTIRIPLPNLKQDGGDR